MPALVALAASCQAASAADAPRPGVGQFFSDPAASQAPPTDRVAAAVPAFGEISFGAPDAKVTVVEYASLTCPHCAAFFADTWPRIKVKYVDTGKVRWVFRDMIGADALSIGETMLLHCVGASNQKAAMAALYRTQNTALEAKKPFDVVAATLGDFGIDAVAAQSCLRDQSLYDGLLKERDHANATYGVSGTPTFFLGNERVKGTKPFDDFDARLAALAAAK
jgi:protein-disulfide isomerase